MCLIQKLKENSEPKLRALEITIREHEDQERVLITSHQKIIPKIKKGIGRAKEIGKKNVLAVAKT